GRNAALQRHLDGGQHDLLVMLQDERQDLDHLAVAAGLPEQVLLQPFEGFGEFSKGSAVAQSTGLALDDRQIVTPVVDGATGAVMRPLDDAGMLAYDMPLRGNHDPFWIDPEADWPIGEGRRHAVAIALQMDQAGRRDPLGVFDEAVEEAWHRHQEPCFLGPDVLDRSRPEAVGNLLPQLPTP